MIISGIHLVQLILLKVSTLINLKVYVFKMICKGIEGNDGNAYKYSLSKEKNHNVSIEKWEYFHI